MKTAVMVAALLGLITVCCAQDIPQNDVPSVVLNSFKTSFPQAQDVEWEMNGDLYNIEFEINKVDHEAWIDKNGRLVKHKTELKPGELPANVRNAVAAKYKNMVIDDADKIEKDGKTYYKIGLDGKTGDLDIIVDAGGSEVHDKTLLY